MNVAQQSYEFKEGELFVATFPAHLSVEGRNGERHVEAKPVLLVCSDKGGRQAWYGDEKKRAEIGCVTIRGREYRIHTGRTPNRHPFEHARRTGVTVRWLNEPSLSYKQYLNDAGQSIDYDTATYKRLDDMVTEACDRYVSDFPEWEYVSVRLAVEELAERATGRVEEIRRDLVDAQAKCDRLGKALLSPDPISLRSIRYEDI